MLYLNTYNKFLTENTKFEDSLSNFYAYIAKYNINSIRDLISDLTNVARDMNKYAKVNKERKIEFYKHKDSFLRFMFNNGHYTNIEFHKYGKDTLVLFTSNVWDDKKDDYISFHIVMDKARKMGIPMSELSGAESGEKKIPNIEQIKNPYKIEEFIKFVDDLETPEFKNAIRKLK